MTSYYPNKRHSEVILIVQVVNVCLRSSPNDVKQLLAS
jgi:hypothetical protein